MDEEVNARVQDPSNLESVRRTLRIMLGGLDPSIANASEEQIRAIDIAFGLGEADLEILVSHISKLNIPLQRKIVHHAQ